MTANGGTVGPVQTTMVDYLKVWLQKLMATLISAKVLVTLAVVYLSYFAMIENRTVETWVDGQVITIHAPLVTGQAWVDLMQTVITVFIGGRIAVPVIEAVAGIFTAKNGKAEETCPEDDEKENGNAT